MDMKYIMLAGFNESGQELELPILFPYFIIHADMRKLFDRYRQLRDLRVVSAGFVRPDKTGQLCAYGESESLKIASRLQDTTIINEQSKSWATSIKGFYE